MLAPPQSANRARLALADIRATASNMGRDNAEIAEALTFALRKSRAIGDNLVTIDNQALEAAHAIGCETDEQQDMRLEIMSLDKNETLQRLEAFPTVGKRGSLKQLKRRLLAAVRGDVLEEATEDESETLEKQERAERMQALKSLSERKAAAAQEAKKTAKSFEKMLDKFNVTDPRVLTIEDLDMLYASHNQGEEVDVANVRAGSIILCRYGDKGGAVETLGQGTTPGMLRSLRVLQLAVPGADHLLLATRLEVRGTETSHTRCYVRSSLKEIRPMTTAAVKEAIEAAGNFTKADGGEESTTAGAIVSTTGSTLTTPRGSGGSGGSGLAEPTDAHGRREGQHVAQAIEASLMGDAASVGSGGSEGWTLESIDAAMADQSIQVIAANGRLLTDGCRASWLANKKRRLS